MTIIIDDYNRWKLETWIIHMIYNTVWHKIFSEVWLVISHRFCYVEYEFGDQIGLSCQDLKIKEMCQKEWFWLYSLHDYV